MPHELLCLCKSLSIGGQALLFDAQVLVEVLPNQGTMVSVLTLFRFGQQGCLVAGKSFEAAWQRAAAETDWQQLADSSPQASDQEVNSTLRQTQLCHAAQICYADPAHSLAQAFPLESVLDMMLEVTGSKQDPVMKNLVEAALLHGESASSLMMQYSCTISRHCRLG